MFVDADMAVSRSWESFKRSCGALLRFKGLGLT